MIGLVILITSILGLVGELSLKTVCIVAIVGGGFDILRSLVDRRTNKLIRAKVNRLEEASNIHEDTEVRG